MLVEEGVTRFDGVLVDGTDVEKPFSARDRRSFRRREDAESNLRGGIFFSTWMLPLPNSYCNTKLGLFYAQTKIMVWVALSDHQKYLYLDDNCV